MCEEIQRLLTVYVQNLPEVKQRRFNEGLQRDLSASVADKTVVLKAKELLADQQKTERRLYDDRELLLRSLQGHPLLEIKLVENDAQILKIMDEMCTRQQAVLHGLHVPGFRVTQIPREIELQTMILDFIIGYFNMGLYNKPIVIDGKDHLLGRLAALVAKNLLQGEKIVVLRCEEIAMSGNFHRSKLKYLSFLRKRLNINPSRGPYHLRSPGKIFWRTVRGMLPHKTPRGNAALRNLRAYEGVPHPYDRETKFNVPSANRHLGLKPRRKFCTVGRLSHEVGWQYRDVVAKLEEKRKVKGAAYFEEKKKELKLVEQAKKNVAAKIAPFQKVIESMGYN